MAQESLKDDVANIERLAPRQTAQSINLPMDVFEKLYLAPQIAVKGGLRKTFANPTPLSVPPFDLPCQLS